ncbi:TRAP transporter small permease subunit [Hoeflea sp. YIM 152468]|uniref:TRAP transporter small permease n=1 Tax=Hoeflea sp. YIM 152468 TaxID=3031759 RepID=UPI0023DC8DC8|nr:TRAP transporter small permease subunit [Hoeflea sp. YIM 152468]MDF1608914.1 TRAP transporter small permease subunit [Hoeflea sp. YIM 152468]
MSLVAAAKYLDVALSHVEDGLIVTLSLVALALGVMQVTLRYVFNTGYEWNEALFVLVTVTAMLMAGVRAVREDRHISVDVLPSIVPASVAAGMKLAAVLASLGLCVFLAWCGWLYVGFAKMMDTASPETGVQDWIVYSIMPTMMSLFALRYIIRLIIGVQSKPTHEHGAS